MPYNSSILKQEATGCTQGSGRSIHGKNEYQARVTLDAALRRVRPGTYRIRVIHGHHGGTALRELVRREYGRHPQVLRLEAAGPGVTELVLREF